MIITNESLNKLEPQDLLNLLNDGYAVLIDKPKDWTSFDVVNKIKKSLGFPKIGHTGTLDPFATGLLIILIGKFTKKQNLFTGLDKTYIAKIKLGATTDTLDPTSEEHSIQDISFLTPSEVQACIKSFEGEYEQIPPMFSAKKVSGRRLYSLARQGKTVELQPTKVKIHSIKLINIALPFATFEVNCSKGTYIRSLARDIGNKLGVGAYLVELRRTKIGNFSVDFALSIFEFLDFLKKATIK